MLSGLNVPEGDALRPSTLFDPGPDESGGQRRWPVMSRKGRRYALQRSLTRDQTHQVGKDVGLRQRRGMQWEGGRKRHTQQREVVLPVTRHALCLSVHSCHRTLSRLRLVTHAATRRTGHGEPASAEPMTLHCAPIHSLDHLTPNGILRSSQPDT